MSIAPLHGRPAPLVFTSNQHVEWPRYKPAQLKSARLSTRARRERNRRWARSSLAAAGLVLVMAAAFWAWLSLRG
jgi:hypothetical protein